MNNPAELWDELVKLIEQIGNESIRDFTASMVRNAPISSWQKPASRRHHLPDEREAYGNLLHTVRVTSLCRLISDAVEVDTDDASNGNDVLLSAAVLHDMCRYGLLGRSESSRPDHPELVRQLAAETGLTCDFFEEIMEVVESHMGRWSTGPVMLVVDASTALHLADCIVARWAEVMPKGTKERKTSDRKEEV